MNKSFSVVAIRTLAVSGLVAFGAIALPPTGSFAQSTSETSRTSVVEDPDIAKINQRIDNLMVSLKKRRDEQPLVAEQLEAKVIEIDSVRDKIDEMIGDLQAAINEVNSDSLMFEKLDQLNNEAVETLALAQNEGIKKYIDDAQEDIEQIGALDTKRGKLVAAGLAAIRDLEENKEKLILVKRLRKMDEAIAIYAGSLDQLDMIVKEAEAVAQEVSIAISE